MVESKKKKCVEVDEVVMRLNHFLSVEEQLDGMCINSEKLAGNIAEENFWSGQRTAIRKIKLWLKEQGV